MQTLFDHVIHFNFPVEVRCVLNYFTIPIFKVLKAIFIVLIPIFMELVAPDVTLLKPTSVRFA